MDQTRVAARIPVMVMPIMSRRRSKIRFQAVLLPDRTPTPLAGHSLVVIDPSEGH
jgi:hypothetical protein